MKYGDFEGDARDLIQQNLDQIERELGVRVLYAVESGSRAWGFASPDSDYDVRFIYVRPVQYYVSMNPHKKDTIEWVVDETLDICGWDLTKALQLAQKGNLFLFEWAQSPMVYRTGNDWMRVWEVAQEYFSCKAAMHSYYGIANNTEQDYLQDESVSYKKYLYALRPLLACKYIAERGSNPPVAFSELVSAVAPDDLAPAIDELLERKARMSEKDKGPRIAAIDAFIADGLDRYGKLAGELEDDHVADRAPLDRVFLRILGL